MPHCWKSHVCGSFVLIVNAQKLPFNTYADALSWDRGLSFDLHSNVMFATATALARLRFCFDSPEHSMSDNVIST